MSSGPESGNQIQPWHVAASIAVAVAVLLLLFWLDLRQNAPGFTIDPDITLSDYEERFNRHAFEYSIWTLEQAKTNFQWSLRSSQYIFWVSMLISVSGICFAFWQFAQAGQFDRASSERDEVEVKTELASLSFKTRSVATFVLMISLLYLLIYVGFLYGVDVVEGPLRERPRVDDEPGVASPVFDEEDIESDSDPVDFVIPDPPEMPGGD
ncbi:hypothetical protein [Paracoccus marinaquae]|uniref:DUF5671 domain-containing protein n=1 Tax=Paracoccus marinaquae TaxID=2841926 RepID=A0ABS6AFI3_9RHOB|nr:hypothetical protein [Paracoccus marinaquae]MBU3029363.1 hypothetical protein [Paracoccus marinaquae]